VVVCFEFGTLMTVNPIDIVLLLALPASGKSEIRRYLASLPADVALDDLGLMPTVQIDDYPYVHAMRRISQETRRLGMGAAFFESDDAPFADTRDWGTLTVLLDEDVRALGERRAVRNPASWLLDRLDHARAAVGAPTLFDDRSELLESAISADAVQLLAGLPAPIEGPRTLVIEFARGGPQGASMPLPAPIGYRYSLSLLSPDILARAVILYVWVTPAESRRKNRDRARPESDGSILHHGVPEAVMRTEYGVDDMAWLLETSQVPGTITVDAHGRSYQIPTARFDNRVDRTSFLRSELEHWSRRDLDVLHGQLVDVFGSLRARMNAST
jgi:hypothetical protein